MPDQIARPPIEATEALRLQMLFGDISFHSAHLELSTTSKGHWWSVLDSDRRAEVVLVLPRAAGRVLLITKPSYPLNTYRLPTGGVGLQEDVISAANREVLEETGLTLRLDRVVGVVDWTFYYRGEARRFASYLCLFPSSDSPVKATDERENISAYRELPWRELDRVAAHLRHLPVSWASWGQQRATPHEVLMQLLGERHVFPSFLL